jgi:hypothetical protein
MRDTYNWREGIEKHTGFHGVGRIHLAEKLGPKAGFFEHSTEPQVP